MEHLLIVDDNRDNREYLVNLLGYKGYQVTEAEDGREALDMVREHKPDLVICDILMPVIDGYDFVRRLRQEPEIAATRIIFYTAHYLEDEAKDLAAAAGISRVLEKPCEPETILRHIREALEEPAASPSKENIASFSDEHLRLVTDKLYRRTGEVGRLNQRLAALVELNLQLASERNPHQLLNQVCHGARELIGAEYAALAIRDNHNGKVHYFTTSGINAEHSIGLNVDTPVRGILGEVMLKNSIRRHEDIDGSLETGLPDGYPKCRNLIAAPITSLTKTYGWLCLTNKNNEEGFNDEDEQLLSILCAQTGRVYENGSLYTKIRFHSGQLEQEVARRTRVQSRLETQYDVSRILSRAMTFEEAIPELMATIAGHMGFDIGLLWEVDDDRDELRCAYAWHSEAVPEPAVSIEEARTLTIPRHSGLSGEVWDSAEPRWLPDMLDEIEKYRTPFELVEVYRSAGLHAAAAFPIVLRNRVWGVMTFYSREIMMEEPGILEMLTAIDGQIALFMERNIQQENIKRLNRIHAVLSGINTTIVHTRDRGELFRKTCRIAIDQGQLQMAWIGFLDKAKNKVDALTVDGIRGLGGTKAIQKKLERKKEIQTIKRFLEHAESVVCNNLRSGQAVDFPLTDVVLEYGARSAAAFPLNINEESSGLLTLYSSEPDFFDEDEMVLLKELAGDLSFAMQFIRNEEQLNYLAYHEPITGLYNRIAMYIELARVTELADKRKNPFAILLVNINDFRDINDTLGHKNGDELLKQFARRLQDTVWESDIVACLGGDDFAILLPHLADKNHINLVIHKLVEALLPAFTVAELPVNIEATLGVALFPDHGTSADILWQRADVALRHAKETHQQYVFYSSDIDDYDPHRLALIGELRRAIDENELVLHYQPLVDLRSNRTIGVEALVRWQHPEHGLIYPDRFIPYSEHTGLINLLTSWVLRNALEQIIAWSREGFDLELAVNLSASNLHNRQLVGEILALTQEHKFPLEKLILEITETAIMVDPKLAGQVLTELHDAGVQISIDDFGTGQSSLTYLKDLPVNRMKIDKTFVIGIQDARNKGIVKSTIDLAHNLKLMVTAEGVEDEDSLQLLKNYHCDHAQGYYLFRPKPAAELDDWLRDSPWPCVPAK
ncbi:MAG: EAL domain-containing protein [Gammaproteobacteria bacterium]